MLWIVLGEGILRSWREDKQVCGVSRQDFRSWSRAEEKQSQERRTSVKTGDEDKRELV
jgi:hypothetical protein